MLNQKKQTGLPEKFKLYVLCSNQHLHWWRELEFVSLTLTTVGVEMSFINKIIG